MDSWFVLPHLAAVRIEGSDGIAFAQAQFTSPFPDTGAQAWGLTAWCNPKGRVLYVIVARTYESHVDLVIPIDQASELFNRLRMYAIGRKVTLHHCDHVAGALSTSAADAALGFDSGRSLAVNKAAAAAAEPFIQAWREADLRAGVAWLGPASSGQYLPQALGLEERGGLSYRKGCYPGQEIIARVHYLGKAKDRLSAFIQRDAQDTDSDELVAADGKPVGRVLQSMSRCDTNIGLAVVSADLAPETTVQRGRAQVTLLPPEAL